MTVSSRVVLLPSIAEAASILGSSMIVWSEEQIREIVMECKKNKWRSSCPTHISTQRTKKVLLVKGTFQAMVVCTCFHHNVPMTSLCWPMISSLGTSGFSSSLRNSSRLSASPPFLLFLISSGTRGVRQRVNIWNQKPLNLKGSREKRTSCKVSSTINAGRILPNERMQIVPNYAEWFERTGKRHRQNPITFSSSCSFSVLILNLITWRECQW